MITGSINNAYNILKMPKDCGHYLRRSREKEKTTRKTPERRIIETITITERLLLEYKSPCMRLFRTEMC